MGRGWKALAVFIIRYRIALLVLTFAMTVFMAMSIRIRLIYDVLQIIPDDDQEMIEFRNFKREFGEDGNTIVVGLEADNIFTPELLNGVLELSDSIRKLRGVTSVASLPRLVYLTADQDSGRFVVNSLMRAPISSQAEADSIRKLYESLPFYQDMIVNRTGTATLVAANIDSLTLYSDNKIRISDDVSRVAKWFSEKYKVKTHLSGLPLIRAFTLKTLPEEMRFFLILAVLLTAISLLLFFRSFVAVFVPLVIVVITVIWTLGVIGLLGYNISILSAVLPSLITVIGIPNAIYLLTKYHIEYVRTRHKMPALINVIQKIGIVTVLTNMNTAAGFLVLAWTDIRLMKEFGIVAGISVIFTFLLSIILIPIAFSFLPPPTSRQTKHMRSKVMNGVIEKLNYWVHNFRGTIYIVSAVVTIVGVVGIFYIRPVSYLVDDIPETNSIHADLKFLEDNFRGVLPFEIVVNTHRKQGITRTAVLKKIETFQEELKKYPEISHSISILDMFKFGRQALLSGDPAEYQLPAREEMIAIQDYARKSEFARMTGTYTIFDSTYSLARIKANIGDVGSLRIKEIIHDLDRKLQDLFVENADSMALQQGGVYKVYGEEPFRVKHAGKEYKPGEVFRVSGDSSYSVTSGTGKVDFSDRIRITGTTKMFIKNNDYLISNLIQNMIAAIVVIALMMLPLFRSPRMMFISLVPNIIPLLLTTGIMGFAGIPLKPSTALIYSMSFGISIDNTIHFLARYRFARRMGENVSLAVTNSFKDTGLGMIYTSIILLVGFIIFAFSSHGGTVALGQLTSITLLLALFANLLLLPAMILTLVKDTEKADADFSDFVDAEEEEEGEEEEDNGPQ